MHSGYPFSYRSCGFKKHTGTFPCTIFIWPTCIRLFLWPKNNFAFDHFPMTKKYKRVFNVQYTQVLKHNLPTFDAAKLPAMHVPAEMTIKHIQALQPICSESNVPPNTESHRLSPYQFHGPMLRPSSGKAVLYRRLDNSR